MTPDTIPCPPPDDWAAPTCQLCGYSGTECSCHDCAVGENVVLLPEYEPGEVASC